MSRSIEDLFPALRGQPWSITSPPDPKYNCIAWSAGMVSPNWWPDADGEHSWPPDVTRAETIEAFRDAFATLGYAACNDESFEPGFEKIAIFALVGAPKHAARQLDGGALTARRLGASGAARRDGRLEAADAGG